MLAGEETISLRGAGEGERARSAQLFAVERHRPAMRPGARTPELASTDGDHDALTSDQATRFGAYLLPVERTVFGRGVLRLSVFHGRQGELF